MNVRLGGDWGLYHQVRGAHARRGGGGLLLLIFVDNWGGGGDGLSSSKLMYGRCSPAGDNQKSIPFTTVNITFEKAIRETANQKMYLICWDIKFSVYIDHANAFPDPLAEIFQPPAKEWR
jgi:hypothetical protein